LSLTIISGVYQLAIARRILGDYSGVNYVISLRRAVDMDVRTDVC